MTAPAAPSGPLPQGVAVALVAGSSAAVLVVELVALRLLAPYLGLTLETSTLVIGIALAAIALGSWVGGVAADRRDPRALLAPLLGVSGLAVAATPLLVRTVAETAEMFLVPVATATILVPGALLSAVSPAVTKIQLTTLEETGAVVGRLSGVGTIGAIAGTVLTGFVLISRLPVSGILLGLGLLLVVVALVLPVLGLGSLPGRGGRPGAALVLVLGGTTAVTTLAPGGCDRETTYHCARVEADPERPGGRTLVLDGLRHSYVDVDDPTHLEFTYVRAIAAAVDARFPAGVALRAHHLGGGGLTLPRFLDAVRPGTRSTVSEIDPGVVALDRELLGLDDGPGTGLEVRVEDGRLGLARLPDAVHDLVVGDAFGGVAVPWHLTTVEVVREVDRVLADDGLYAVNLIDYGDLAFARAELATLAAVFPHVVLLADAADRGPDPDGGNLVALAGRRPIDPAALTAALAARDVDWAPLAGPALDAWLRDAEVLTDDRAPVDQLLQPAPLP